MAPKSVDTSLHAQPSGHAATLADQHSSDHPLKLYGGWFCPFVQRSWITLQEKRIPYQYVEINPYKKAPEFLVLNPRGLVPTLGVPVHETSGQELKPLYESTVICAYLDETYDGRGDGNDEANTTQHGPSLLPEDSYERARCRIWIDHISTRIIPTFYRFIQHLPEKQYSIDEVRAEFLDHIKTVVRACHPTGPFFLGDQFSMVDIMIAPWMARIFLIDHYKPGGAGIPSSSSSATSTGTSTGASVNDNHDDNKKKPENKQSGDEDEDAEIWRRWHTWFDAVTTRQSVLDTLSDREQYIEAYKRYAEDMTGSQVGHATRSGRGLP